MPTLHFKGKTFVQNHHLAIKYHQLVPKKELSLTDPAYGGTGAISLHDNLIIQGDNLKVLKALLPTYSGKVKCIYIDPPYNTGNEKWVYNDNVNSPMLKEWMGKEVDIEDMTRHDKWLCMMMPRLKLLRELLSEIGVIFISIDDNEQHNLRVLMDEIFGNNNFIACFAVIRSEGGGLAKQAVTGHEYVLTYAKNLEIFDPLKKDKDVRGSIVQINNDDFVIEEDWLRVEFGKYGTLLYKDIEKVKGIEKKNEIDKGIQDGKYILLEKSIGTIVGRYKKLSEESSKFYTVLKHLNKFGKDDLSELGLKEMFDYPKPVSLVKELIKGATFFEKNSIILDSFAGSGTTAQAVLELNKEDGGNRKFILVEQEDYANTITAERVRRVIKGVKTAKNEKLKNGTGGTFSYFELGETIEMENLLKGKNLPSFTEFARYLFYTATGEEFNEKSINEKTGFIGESKNHEVYLIYKPDIEWLKRNALTLDGCQTLPKFKNKQRLVFAPCKYVDDQTCLEYRIDFCQLPYEIYRIQN